MVALQMLRARSSPLLKSCMTIATSPDAAHRDPAGVAADGHDPERPAPVAMNRRLPARRAAASRLPAVVKPPGATPDQVVLS
jgi:hypothetical protein